MFYDIPVVHQRADSQVEIQCVFRLGHGGPEGQLQVRRLWQLLGGFPESNGHLLHPLRKSHPRQTPAPLGWTREAIGSHLNSSTKGSSPDGMVSTHGKLADPTRAHPVRSARTASPNPRHPRGPLDSSRATPSPDRWAFWIRKDDSSACLPGPAGPRSRLGIDHPHPARA